MACHQNSKPDCSVVFSWYGLPQYAARLIRAAADSFGENIIVIGSRPSVPIAGMEEILGCPTIWLNGKEPISWKDIGLEVPEIFFQSGWAYPAFNALGQEVKRQGGHVIGMSDANWRGDLRQLILGPIAFRLLHRRRFDFMITPGKSGVRVLRYFGMPSDRIRQGMYGADPAIFCGGYPLASRPRSLLFVGQFIERKNVLGLARAFQRFVQERPGWTLRICGSGPQRDLIPEDPAIIVEDFVQPGDLARWFRESRFLVLPSIVEAWGLVVHEAASCGCGLLLSDAIGSADDLADPENSLRFTAGCDESLLAALHTVADYDDTTLTAIEARSRARASEFGPERFAKEATSIINELRKTQKVVEHIRK